VHSHIPTTGAEQATKAKDITNISAVASKSFSFFIVFSPVRFLRKYVVRQKDRSKTCLFIFNHISGFIFS